MKKVYLIAVIFALIAGFATYLFANQIESKSTIRDAKTVTVVVALRDIPENTKVNEAMFDEEAPWFGTKEVVADYAVPNFVTNKNDLLEKVFVDPIYAGEQISSARFVEADSDLVGLSFKLADGMKAFSFNAGAANGVDGYISVGDTVDVIVYEKNQQGKATAKVAYKDLKVIRVSNATDYNSASQSGSTITKYSTLTVEVTEKQALELYEIEKNYDFKLVLNPRENE